MRPLRVLLVEDRPVDAELIVDYLRQAGFEPEWQRVETEPEYLAHVSAALDLILSDHGMPQFSTTRALQLLQQRGLDIPFIVVSGTLGEDAAVDAMKQGAVDYLRKDRLTRLGEAVKQALRQKQLRDEKRQAEIALEESKDRFRALIENGSDIITVMDADGRVQYISPSVERILGYKPEELIGQVGLNYVYPDDREEAAMVLPPHLALPSQPASRNLRVRPKDGSLRVLEVIVSNLLDNPAVRGIVLNARDITEHAWTRVPLDHEPNVGRMQVSHRMVAAQEAERRRLAQELHDQVGPNLSVLGINLGVLRSRLPTWSVQKVDGLLQDCLQLVDETVQRIQDIMAELRPGVLDDYGLVAALRWYTELFSNRTGLVVTWQGPERIAPLSPDVETALFRIAQEALTNVAKHAHATQVTMTLEAVARAVRLTVEDNGRGFDPAERRQPGERQTLGLLSMQERAEAAAGRLRIEAAPGRGTRVVVEMPR